MNPEEASALLYDGHEVKTTKVKDGAGDDYWQVQYRDSYWNRLPNAPYEDAVLYAAAPEMAHMIAGMREEWGVEVTHYLDSDLHTRWGYTDRQDAEAFARYMGRDSRWSATRVVRRYVTEPEEA